MIDIIIPCYNSHETLESTLDSIKIQTIKDKLKVLIVDDCSDESYQSIVEQFTSFMEIKEIRTTENVGAGLARELGIQSSDSEYIIFIDSDDRFADSKSVELLFNEIEKGFDYVNSYEFDERRGRKLLLKGNLHAKIFRRKFIEDNNLHFNNERVHEDNYFNNLVVLTGAKISQIPECTYYYKTSLTNDSEKFEHLEIYLKNIQELTAIVKNKNYSKERLADFKKDKYYYLKSIYKTFNDEQKETFKGWLEEYDKDFTQFIELADDEFEKKIVEHLRK